MCFLSHGKRRCTKKGSLGGQACVKEEVPRRKLWVESVDRELLGGGMDGGWLVFVCARRISGYPLPRPELHTKLNNLL